MKKNKKYFGDVPTQFDFVKNEEKILAWWKKTDLVKKYLDKNKNSKKRFSFIDGPITANNPMGVHHAWGRTLKDLYQKYKNAQGFKQRFQNGFDCQGLWVEVEVEKALGFNSKKDIEKYGLDKFTLACKARVNQFAALQTEQSQRLGYFMDWDNSYYTMSETNNLYIWHFLKQCQQRDLIYKAKSSTTWCPRCETGLSKHEQADGYKEIQDESVYVKFKLKGKNNEYFLVWTTTPWTLSANVLLAVNPEHQYVKVKVKNESWYLAQESANRLDLQNQTKIKAEEFLALEYDSLYDIPAQKGIKHFVTKWNLVDPAEGTGIVHIAPGGGEDDYILGKELGVPALSPLDETGHFGPGYMELTGKYAHDVGSQVIEYLKSKNLLYKTETITHSYPHCWRCGTKCLFRLEDNWFINCEKIKPELKKAAKSSNWVPKYAGKRMQDWLDNMGDWMISRKRFYGLALPFYECGKCKELVVVGSKKELKELAVNPELVDKLPSVHRPWIDRVKIKCPKCKEQISRVLDVGDCWLDAGVVPFSTLKYFEDKAYWGKWFPADLVMEMIEQIRLWFYSMLVYGVIFEKTIPYQNVLSHGEVKDEKGKRMSKTKKNGIPYDEAVEKMGADTLRWLYSRQKPHVNLNLGYKAADEIRRRFLFLYWNSYRFLITYANLNSWQPKKELELKNLSPLDKWILSRLENTKKQAENKLDQFLHQDALKNIEIFLEDLSLWYIRRSRERLSPNNKNKKDQEACFNTLYYCLEQLSLILSVFIPFLPETIYQNLKGNKDEPGANSSVHLQTWPKGEEKYIDNNLEKLMIKLREEVTEGHGQRKVKNLPVKQPLSALLTPSADLFTKKKLDYLVKDELNVKKLTKSKKVGLDTRLTPELKEEGKVRELIRDIQTLRRKENLDLKDRITIFAPSWPKAFEKEILLRTGGKAIKKDRDLKIKHN